MKCRRCGAEASGKFCSECGTPLGEPSIGYGDMGVTAGAAMTTIFGIGIALTAGINTDYFLLIGGALLIVLGIILVGDSRRNAIRPMAVTLSVMVVYALVFKPLSTGFIVDGNDYLGLAFVLFGYLGIILSFVGSLSKIYRASGRRLLP